MARIHSVLIGGCIPIAAILAAACRGNDTTSSAVSQSALDAAFASVPFGYTSSQNSFDASAGAGNGPWMPEGGRGRDGRGGGPGGGGPGFLGLMGGGLGPDFLGGPGLGRGFGHGRFGDPAVDGTCAYSATTGRIACDPVTRNGVTITWSLAYTDAAGAAQSAFDSVTTNTVNTRVSVSGTFTRRDSSTSTVTSSSDRTVSGLAKGSTQRTVNGTSAGHETTTGANSDGAFTAVRDVGDTTTGLVVPVRDTGRAYPTAGTVIRSMKVTLTLAGQSPQTSTRREVVTYDGSTTAKVVITRDGETRTCTLPLPFGKPTCE